MKPPSLLNSFKQLLSQSVRACTRHTRPSCRLVVEALETRFVPSAYTVTDLGTFGGADSQGYSLNEKGQVAGFATTLDDLPQAFRWENGHLTNLGTLGGMVGIGLGINNEGHVVGTANNTEPDTVNGGQQNHAFLWDHGVMRDLGTVPGTINSDAWAVNARDQAVGWSCNLPPDDVDPAANPFNSHPFVSERGVMKELALPTGMTNGFAGAINEAGLIAGNGFDGTTLHALIWHTERSGTYVPLDLGFPVGTGRSSLRGINDDGDVVGDARLIGGTGHAFWWRLDRHGHYVPNDLGTLGGRGSGALDVNNHDQIVGRSRTSAGMQHAFLYDANGMHDLNEMIPAESGWVLDTARSINDHGQIVGLGNHDGEFHAFLLNPSGGAIGPRQILVHAGQSIQAAVNAALPGTTIRIEPGIYAEAVAVAKPNIHLIGLRGPHGEGVVITNPGDEEDGVTVTDAGDGFELRNVTVRGFEDNGVVLTGVDGFVLAQVKAEDNGEYGLFPVQSAHGVIDHCIASGHSDTGLYVGQSHDVVIRHSTAFANVVGISVEDSSNVRISDNEAYDNTGGIFVELFPGLPVTTSSGVLVDHNYVHDNNRPNFAEPGDIESFVPRGIGILVLGADHVTVRNNLVTGNRFVGIGVGSSLIVGALAGIPPDDFAGIEPNPDGARVTHNTAVGNGGDPPVLGFPSSDLLWDGTGTDNCWSENTFGSSFPSVLPECPHHRPR